jgi:hypothetical protein
VKLGVGTGAAGGAGSSVVGGGRGRGSVSAVGLYGHLERRDVVLDEYFVGLSIGAGGRHIAVTDCCCFGDDPSGTNPSLQLPSSWTVVNA